MLGDARKVADMGRCLGADLTEREVDWQVRTEWARSSEDVLWRRSKLGLRMREGEVTALEQYLDRRLDQERDPVGTVVAGSTTDTSD